MCSARNRRESAGAAGSAEFSVRVFLLTGRERGQTRDLGQISEERVKRRTKLILGRTGNGGARQFGFYTCAAIGNGSRERLGQRLIPVPSESRNVQHGKIASKPNSKTQSDMGTKFALTG
jgi:hypothetical protein